MQERPTTAQMRAASSAGEKAADEARALRGRLKRRKTPTRTRQLTAARAACAAAAEPLRSYIGMVAWHDIYIDHELMMKSVMVKLRYERRQIDKML